MKLKSRVSYSSVIVRTTISETLFNPNHHSLDSSNYFANVQDLRKVRWNENSRIVEYCMCILTFLRLCWTEVTCENLLKLFYELERNCRSNDHFDFSRLTHSGAVESRIRTRNSSQHQPIAEVERFAEQKCTGVTIAVLGRLWARKHRRFFNPCYKVVWLWVMSSSMGFLLANTVKHRCWVVSGETPEKIITR